MTDRPDYGYARRILRRHLTERARMLRGYNTHIEASGGKHTREECGCVQVARRLSKEVAALKAALERLK